MSDILLNLISDMKICLAAALGSGLLFGYLYTKFRAKERFMPEINAFSSSIASKRAHAETLLQENTQLESELSSYNEKIHEGNLTITKFKNDISDLEENKIKLQAGDQELKNQHQKQEALLGDHRQELSSLQSLLGVTSVEGIETYVDKLQADLQKKIQTLQQKTDSLMTLGHEEKELKKETSHLYSSVGSLTATLDKHETELKAHDDEAHALRSKLRHEYENILGEKEENLAKIEGYKAELIAIKNKLS